MATRSSIDWRRIRDAQPMLKPKVMVTPYERDQLFEERLRALRESPSAWMSAPGRSAVDRNKQRARLCVAGRDRGGDLLAAVYVGRGDGAPWYVRHLRIRKDRAGAARSVQLGGRFSY